MSNQVLGLRHWLEVALRVVLPQECFACGAACGGDVLCRECRTSLPGQALARCRICALALPVGEICGACLREMPPFDATRCALDYGFPVDRLVHALKYAHRLPVTRLFVELMAAQPRPRADVVVPMPLHPARLRARGFNQAAELARPLARHWELPVRLNAVVRDLDTPPQAGLAWKERGANVRGAFRVTADLQGLRVVVVDDVMTTGATLAELARGLKGRGAVSVENRILARTPPPA